MKYLIKSLKIIGCIGLLVILTNVVVLAAEKQGSIKIVASIQPQRIIVVDNDLVIWRIYSNTAVDVDPIVFVDQIGGEQIPFAGRVRGQYESLKRLIDFSSPGLVYERESGSSNQIVRALIDNSLKLIRKIAAF